MQREILKEDLNRLYTANDMVRADCLGCLGCHTCCTGMGASIVLDPYDARRLCKGLGKPFGSITEIEWNLQEGMLLPNLRMAGEEEACAFLDENGRCSVHAIRPGFCRLFPLGRIYEEKGFRYFLQSGECPKTNRSKVKVKKWLEQPELSKYEAYIFEWHAFIKAAGERILSCEDDKLRKDVWSFLVKLFFLTPYEGDDFYQEFAGRKTNAEKLMNTIEWD